MLYLTNEAGQAIGEILKGLPNVSNLEIKLTQDCLIATVNLLDVKTNVCKTKKIKIDAPKQTNKSEEGTTGTKGKKRIMVECDGLTLSLKDWASKLGTTYETVRSRVAKTGNPYGRETPTDNDIIAINN